MWGLENNGSALESGSGAFNNTTSFDPQDNSSLSCAARNIQGSAMLPYTEMEVNIQRAFHAIVQVFLFFVAGFLNLFVIVLVAKNKKLQNVSFGIALQMVVLNNLLLSNFVRLVSLITTIANRWVFGEHICALVGMTVLINFPARSGFMLTFIIDRFLLVFCPFTYPKYRTRTVVILSIAALIFAVVLSGIGYALDCYTFRPYSWMCSVNSGCSENCSLYLALLGALVLVPTRIISLFLFAMLFMKARKAKKAMASIGIQRPKQDWKATITFFMLFMSLFVLSIPSVAIYVIVDKLYKVEEVSPAVHVLIISATYMISLLTITDPIIIMRNADVREVIREMKTKMTWKCCRKVGLNN